MGLYGNLAGTKFTQLKNDLSQNNCHGFVADSSPVVSRSLKGVGINWRRLMKQGMMGRKKGKERDDW